MTSEPDDASPGLTDSAALTDITQLSESSGLCGGPGQISCSEANELIQIYLDHRTDPDTGERVAEHLGDCPPCESEFVVYQRIIASLSRCRQDLPQDTKQRLESFCRDLSCDDA